MPTWWTWVRTMVTFAGGVYLVVLGVVTRGGPHVELIMTGASLMTFGGVAHVETKRNGGSGSGSSPPVSTKRRRRKRRPSVRRLGVDES